MLDVLNESPTQHAALPMKDKDGRDQIVLIAKQTFDVDARGHVTAATEAPRPYLVDEWHGEDPAMSSIRKPSDVFDFKPGTDVLLVGHAHPRRPGLDKAVDVSLRMGPIKKSARVYGPRVWESTSGGRPWPGPAQPIQQPVPLKYELAWGGLDLSDPERPVGDARNTVGRGVASDPSQLVGQPAVQIERGSLTSDHTPWCFGPLHRHWEPRCRFAGTYDEAWMSYKMPLLPDDFDPRFNVCAPEDQWCMAGLAGDEPVEVIGATPEGLWQFALPRLHLGFSMLVAGRRSEARSHLDTVLIDADAMRVELTWRASFRLPRKYEEVEQLLIMRKEKL